MRELQGLQNDFQNYLLDKTTAIQTAVVDVAPVPASTRLNVYKDGYYLRLLEALQQDYEVLHALIGDDEFDQLARDYIRAHPSTFRSIRWYGKELSVFLQEKTNQSCLIEMAQFEWLLTETFDAADSEIMTIEDMAKIPPKKWPMMRFVLHPSLRQLNLSTNTVSMWQSYKEKGLLTAPEQTDTYAPWIIWRRELNILFCSLTPAEHYMLQTLLSGGSFKMLCEGLDEWVSEENIAMEAALFLKRLIFDRLIVRAI